VSIIKTYDFTSRKREFGRVVFALALDKKKLAERIIIGKVDDVRRLLDGGDSEVYYDEVRPLGNLLLTFESDPDGNWNKNHMILRESYGKEKLLPVTKTTRWNMATPVQEFLQAKYKSSEPSAMFAAILTWEEYVNPLNEKSATADTFTSRLHMLYKPFRVYDKFKPWQDEATAALSVALQDGESGVELWYIGHAGKQSRYQSEQLPKGESRAVKRTTGPTIKQPFEVVVASSSFLPIIFYYTHKIKEWGFVYQQCKVCNNHFLARSRHYELCSDECRKIKATTAKKEFDERAKSDKLEQLDEAAYYYWYNRLRKLRKGKAANLEKAAVFKVEFDVFRKEAVKRKAAAKNRQISIADFASWLVEQQEVADELMGKFMKNKAE